MDNTFSDISLLVKASKYVDPDLQITIGLRQALFSTLLPDKFATPLPRHKLAEQAQMSQNLVECALG